MYHYRISPELSKLKSRCFLPIAGKMERTFFLVFSNVRHPILVDFYSENKRHFANFSFRRIGFNKSDGNMLARILSRYAAAGSTCLSAWSVTIKTRLFNFRFRKK